MQSYSKAKFILLTLWVAIVPLRSQAFVVPMPFAEKCSKAEAILHITVEKVESVDLTKNIAWQFHAVARCKVISSYKGKEDWKGKLVFIPCDYHFDESPCDIEEGKEYVVFLETMGNFSKFGHPVGPLCCHLISDGKVFSGIPEKGAMKVEEFVQLIHAELLKSKHPE